MNPLIDPTDRDQFIRSLSTALPGFTQAEWDQLTPEKWEAHFIKSEGPEKTKRAFVRWVAKRNVVNPLPKGRQVRKQKAHHEEASIEDTFTYDPTTGQIGRVGVDLDVIGVTSQGYRFVRYGGKSCLLHHLIPYLVTGAYPAGRVRHIDGDKKNDRFENLGPVVRKSWQAKVSPGAGAPQISLGYYATRDERDARVFLYKMTRG